MPHSHHSHSGQFCRHAKDTLEEVVKEAIRQGFTLFGLSEHAPRYRLEDLFPEEADLTPHELELTYLAFLAEANRLKAKYVDEITLLLGLETDYITPLDLERTTALLSRRTDIEYVVGSVHHVQGVSIDFDKPTWSRSVRAAAEGETGTTMVLDSTSSTPSLPTVTDPSTTPEGVRAFLLAYFEAQYTMLQTHKPEVVGHIDLCLLWIPHLSLRPPGGDGLEGVWELVERNVRYAISYGALFEANAAALRKGWETSYPSRDILRSILSLGGRICLSDDSHGVSYVGLNYLRMRDYLVGEGVKEIWYLVPVSARQSGDEEVGSRGRVVARRVAGWENDTFWETLRIAQSPTS